MTLRIGIVGAGIGGLAVATLLSRAGHDVALFDQFEAPRPVGSGLVIQPVGLTVLDHLGTGGAVRRDGAAIRRMLGHEAATGRQVLDVSYTGPRDARHGVAIHRALLFAALLETAKGAGVRPIAGARAIASSETARGRVLQFADGGVSEPFDLAIDASGARSVLSPLIGRDLPYGAIWGTVPWPEDTGLPLDELRQCYRRASRMMGVLPIGTVPGGNGNHAAIFWSLRRDGFEAWAARPVEEWKAEASALWPDFAPFLRTIADHDQMTRATYSHGSLSSPYAPALAFIGDAAHRASPQLGQGANMALLDALALAKALEGAEVVDALPLYARIRRWHVRLYQMMSWAFTPQYQSDSRILPVIRDHLFVPVSRTPPVPAILRRLVGGDIIPPLAGQAFP